MGGGKTNSTTDTKLTTLQVQQSAIGLPITKFWGTARLAPNILWFNNFTATAVSSQSSGKGGGSSSNKSYTYAADIILGLCAGPISAITTVYKDNAVYTNTSDGSETALQQAGLSLFTGALGQAVWSYLASSDPSEAIGYSGIAYVCASNYALGSGGSVPSHKFECVSTTTVSGLPDANPATFITDFFSLVPSWPAAALGDMTQWSNYCLAANLLLSPVLDQQRTGSDALTEFLQATNSDCVWTGGQLNIVPYGDMTISGNGATYTPALTPQYDLDLDDFIPTKPGEPPIKFDRTAQSQAFNKIQVEFLDRTQQYNSNTIQAFDQANIEQFGERLQDPTSIHSICDPVVASNCAQLLLQRTLYNRTTLKFTLGQQYVRLDPLDYVTLTDPITGLNRQLVRIKKISEDAKGNRAMEAEPVYVGVAQAPVYTRQGAGGYQPAYNALPGNVATPVILNPPVSLTSGALETWVATSGGDNWGGAEVWTSLDGTTYAYAGEVAGPARYGQLTTTLPLGADPDTVNTPGVDLTVSEGVLGSFTSADADAAVSLCAVGAELISYETATQTAANKYTLSYLRRGLFNTPIASHSIGEEFVRLDDSIFKIGYQPQQLGKTIYVKFLSFNIYGRSLQSLADVTAYTITLGPSAALPAMCTNLRLSTGGTTWTGNTINLVCNVSANATSYTFNFYKADGTTLIRSFNQATPAVTYTSAQAAADGDQREYKVAVYANNSFGSSSPTTELDITNAAPAAVSITTSTGGAVQASLAWGASSDPDLGGYVLYYSPTSGFNPVSAGQPVSQAGTSTTLYGLAAGTYYWIVAPYDPWTANPSFLNFSAQNSFTITTGGGPNPSGGGGSGGYNGRPNTSIP